MTLAFAPCVPPCSKRRRSRSTIVDDIDIEDPRAGEVLVRVSHCGVCHSDLSLANGTFPVMAPTVLGHEAAGVVEAVGPGVTELAAGDKVVLTPIAGVQRVLLVRARRVRLLRQQRERSRPGR